MYSKMPGLHLGGFWLTVCTACDIRHVPSLLILTDGKNISNGEKHYTQLPFYLHDILCIHVTINVLPDQLVHPIEAGLGN